MRLLLWLLRLCGFTNLYALVPVAEWRDVQSLLSGFREGGIHHGVNDDLTNLIKEHRRTRQIAEEAHIAACNGLPVSAVAATKIAGQIVVSGMEMPDPKQFMTNKQED